MPVKWIESEGGPLVVVNAATTTHWTGDRGHYDDACAVEGMTATLDIGASEQPEQALVVWGEPLRTTFMPELSALVQWVYADSEEGLLELARDAAVRERWSSGPVFTVSERLLLFDSAIPGDELDRDEESLEISIEPADYRILTVDVESGRTAARLHMFATEQQAQELAT